MCFAANGRMHSGVLPPSKSKMQACLDAMLCLACAGDHLIKLSISHALSQSTKLCVFEERVIEIVASTKDLPEILASTGAAWLSVLRLANNKGL